MGEHKGPKKQEAKGEGCAIWVMSFADMMSLLMSFMVAMLSMSELKSGEKMEKMVKSFQLALGFPGGGWMAQAQIPPDGLTPEEQLKQLVYLLQKQNKNDNKGNSRAEGIEGDNPSVKTIRDGLQYVIGGAVSFESGKAELKEKAREQLANFVEAIKGTTMKIRVRGHAARIPPAQILPYRSLDELSYARALSVKDFLIKKGIRPERITLEACGDTEPLEARPYDEPGRARNRRVEIIMMETLVEDYQGEKTKPAGELNDG